MISTFARNLVLPCGLMILAACSESTNINGLIAQSWAEKDSAALLSRSEILLDKGDYTGALAAATDAYRLAPNCSACAVQLSYSYLGVAGLDLFQLARKMIEKSATGAASLTESSNAAGQLASLASLVGLSDEDYAAITLDGNRLGNLEGAPKSGLFLDLPVFLPKSGPDARNSGSETIQNIAKAIEVLCPFMQDVVKVLGASADIRHSSSSCISREAHGSKQSKALFIWAMSHLVEAIAFHQVVLYQPDGSQPNLQKRTSLIGDRTAVTSLTEYVQAVTDLAAVIDIILPTEVEASKASMLTAMFNDLETVSRAFQNMSAVPAAISNGIVASISELQGQKDKLNTGSENKDERSVAFKDQLTAKMASELQTQISARVDTGLVSEKEHLEMCQAYRTISTESFTSCAGF